MKCNRNNSNNNNDVILTVNNDNNNNDSKIIIIKIIITMCLTGNETYTPLFTKSSQCGIEEITISRNEMQAHAAHNAL